MVLELAMVDEKVGLLASVYVDIFILEKIEPQEEIEKLVLDINDAERIAEEGIRIEV